MCIGPRCKGKVRRLRRLLRRRNLLSAIVVLAVMTGVHHFLADDETAPEWNEPETVVSAENCSVCLDGQIADVSTLDTFRQFDFQPNWIENKSYWDSKFEDRYKQSNSSSSKMPLKVIVVPHSHNDPGWLATYKHYYDYDVKRILNNMVEKLHQHQNMTFIYAEISFFALWWESANVTQKSIVRNLLKEGRLEILTGGWVMTDEATTHLYAMLDQLIEGHQWLKNNLDVSPLTGWSIDPFGHGATLPYLLKSSGLSATVMLRIHYAWKKWLAEKQMGDFVWRQNWACGADQKAASDLLTHNQFFDLYSIVHTCGPHLKECENFDFRTIINVTTKGVPINDTNIKAKADLLVEQYGRVASLSPHNVVLMPLGDDFRFTSGVEWDEQYLNYQKLFDYINSDPTKYQNAQLSFGTPSQYFKVVQERMNNLSAKFSSVRGDFFVYSDIYVDGKPNYWSGFFSTRPFVKQLDRDLEASLRSAEILYTLALGMARQNKASRIVQLLEEDFARLVTARRHLGLFQHHDAITGTSKSFVMKDYAFKLLQGIRDTKAIQSRSVHSLLMLPPGINIAERPSSKLGHILVSDTIRNAYDQQARKEPIFVEIDAPKKRVVLFNSLGQQRQEVVRVHLYSPDVRVLDVHGAAIPYQISPALGGSVMLKDQFVMEWVVDLPPLTITTYVLEKIKENSNLKARAVIYCSDCAGASGFESRKLQPNDSQLENHKLKLLFDGRTGFLKAITDKLSGRTTQCALKFAAYHSAPSSSGAYLFKLNPNYTDPEKNILQNKTQKITIITGLISSQIVVTYDKLLTLVMRVYQVTGPLSEGIFLETSVDFEAPPKNGNTELFMRLLTDLNNVQRPEIPVPEFFTDQNGFKMQKRIKVEKIGIEGNYFPVTSMTYLQDSGRRMSLLVGRAMGAASWQPGWLEVILERRTLLDDKRGLGQAVIDQKRTTTRFVLLPEEIAASADNKSAADDSQPSLLAHHLSAALLYPSDLFVVEACEELRRHVALLSKPLPCDAHLLTLRTFAGKQKLPAASALLLLERKDFSCRIASRVPKCALESARGLHPGTAFRDVRLRALAETSLTGLRTGREVPALDALRLSTMPITAFNLTFG